MEDALFKPRDIGFATQDALSGAKLPGQKKMSPADAERTAQEFESMFMSQMLAPMFEGLETDGLFGGGSAEETFRGMLVNEYGALLSKTGGLGIASSVKSELLKLQEASNADA